MASNNTATIVEDPQSWLIVGHAYTAPLICIAGCLGNILGSIVLTDMEMRAPISILITGLAISNALTLVVYIPFAMLLLNVSGKNGAQSVYAYALMSLISHIVINTSAISNWLTVTVAVYMLAVLQRICDPLKRITASRAKHINYFVYLVVTAMCSPNYYDMFKEANVSSNNVTVWNLGLGYGVIEKSMIDDFNIVVNSVLMRLIPCVILCLVVFTVVRDMRRAVRVSRQFPSVDTSETIRWKSNRVQTLIITRILLTVLVIFTATESSNGVLMLLAYGSRLFFALYTDLGHVLTTLALLNYGVTGLLYCFMSYQFREACKQASCHQVPQQSNY